MKSLVVAKFGGSAIGPDGASIPIILQRIDELRRDAKVIAVFSAPLTMNEGSPRSLTDIILEMGRDAAAGRMPDIETIRQVYGRILLAMGLGDDSDCRSLVRHHLDVAQNNLQQAVTMREFAGEVRSLVLAHAGEILMSHIMARIMKSRGVKAKSVDLDEWPIITDNNIEFTNFLYSPSKERLGATEALVRECEVVSIGGFIGKTIKGVITTYERGGSDRTAADIGILFHKKYDVRIDFEKDSAVVSADPKVVQERLGSVHHLSYNEARLAGMFGMKILDPIVIKEILENGVDIPITITNMKKVGDTTLVRREIDDSNSHPLKIVTGRRNCAIVRMERDASQNMQKSLRQKMRYSEYVVLSPFIRDGTEFSRILFLDGDYVRWGEKYVRSFDPLASITYNRGVVTMIGDELWRLRHMVSMASAKIGEADLNILNMDAQEETSRITIIVEDADDNVADAIRAVHSVRETSLAE